ncbi:MAG: excisionase family DNA-binding protein [Chloroflexota bacterium]
MSGPEEDIRNLLTTGEVAGILAVSTGTVRRWHHEGKLKAYRIGPRGERRFLRRDVGILLLERTLARKKRLRF